MHVVLDPVGGIAGDMFIAAVLDAWPDLSVGMLACVAATGMPMDWRLELSDHNDGLLRGKRLVSLAPEIKSGSPSLSTAKRYSDIRARLRTASLEPRVLERALEIFELLARAEAEVHGVAIDEVHFHELAAWDSIADIVGSAYLIESLGKSSWSVGAVPLGGGRIQTQHGLMPVPAPATARLLQGFECIDDGIAGERVTPTGAAILRYVAGLPISRARESGKSMRLARSGTGFGTRRLNGVANVLRVLAFDEVDAEPVPGRVCVVAFEVDDQTAEDLAVGLESIRAREGVLDVLQFPAFGKKGRLVAHVQILCRPDVLPGLIEACFTETSTIGLRWSPCERATLERTAIRVDVDGKIVSVKVVRRPDGSQSAKTEIEDATSGCTGRLARDRLSQRAVGMALGVSPEYCNEDSESDTSTGTP